MTSFDFNAFLYFILDGFVAFVSFLPGLAVAGVAWLRRLIGGGA